MDNFDIYKLKTAGLTNQQVINVLEYAEIREKELSVKDMAVVSECRNPALFIEKYLHLDDDLLRQEFE